MNDFSHHTPKVLTEADAAAGLAGLPRAVSSEDALRQAESHAAVAETILEASPLIVPSLRATLHTDTAIMLRTLVSERDALAGRVAELEALSERLKLEAQIHAQEARTANSTIAEIYQCVTGATGEPGNWNGAEPVRRRLAELEAALREAQRQLNANAPNCALDTIDAALSTTPESKP